MSQNYTEFRWDARREKAAVLLAENEISDEAIADSIGVTRRTLAHWKDHPVFSAKVAEHVATLEAVTLQFAIAKRRKRVEALDDRWARMKRLLDARAMQLAHIQGGNTGLLVHQQRAIGTGRNQELIDEYVVDTGLLRELREHEKQAAQELGQWVEKAEQKQTGDLVIKLKWPEEMHGDGDNR